MQEVAEMSTDKGRKEIRNAKRADDKSSTDASQRKAPAQKRNAASSGRNFKKSVDSVKQPVSTFTNLFDSNIPKVPHVDSDSDQSPDKS